MGEDNSSRSIQLTRTIFGSTLLKALDVLFNFLLVRYAILFFGHEKYGLWLTLLSFFTWFSAFEFGISSSFRNKLTQQFSEQKIDEIKQWLTRGYKALLIIYLSIIIIVLLSFTFIGSNYNYSYPDFRFAFYISFALYMIYYVFIFLQSVLLATHHTTLTYFISVVQKAILLIGILTFIELDYTPSLSFTFIWFSAIPVLIWCIASFYAYRTILKNIRPSVSKTLKKISPFKSVKPGFFIIQICVLIIFSTDNLIILDSLSGAAVTDYNIAFKYFNILTILFNIVLLPYWASFTEASHQKDTPWIKRNIKRLIWLWVGIAALSVVMIFLSGLVYGIWIGETINISIELSIFMGAAVLINSWNNIFAYFLNSISEIKIQMRILIIAALVNIPLSFILLEYYGLTGVIVATCITLLPLSIALPIQYISIIKNRT